MISHLAIEIFDRYNIITVKLNIAFKRRLNTSRMILARIFIKEDNEEVKGGSGEVKNKRKLKVRERIENKEGGIFAEDRSV